MTIYFKRSQHTHRIISAYQLLIRLFRLTLFSILVVLVSSCEKGILKIGSDILPQGDFVSIKSIDTLSVFSYTMYNDSARTDHPTISFLGQDYDPYFGTTTAGFVTQIRFNQRWDDKPFTVDSMKLYLHLLTTKGGTSDVPHSFSIYEIANQIYTDSAYYSHTPVPLTNFKVENINFPILRTDTINDIELKLPGNGVAFGNYILRDTSKLFYSNSKPDFRSYFKGLYFRMNSNSDPLLFTLSLTYDQTAYYNYFVIFLHDDAGLAKEYSLILDAKNINAAFNRFSHDFSTATLGGIKEHLNTTYKDTLSYMQALNGAFTKIVLPGLDGIKNDPSYDNIAINKARLIVPVQFNRTLTGPYISKSIPLILRLRYKAKSGYRYDVPDYLMAPGSDVNHSFFDGRLDSVNKVYNFNIPAYVQAYLKDATGGVTPELEIYSSTGIRNVIFNANKNKTPVKFEFTYSKF